MPVRLRIILLFFSLVFIILSIVCGAIYYFSYSSRIDFIKTRLTNRSITTARLLSHAEVFDRAIIARIDSATTIALKNKVVQAYDDNNHEDYSYSEVPGDTLHVDNSILEETRTNGKLYFTSGEKDVVSYYFTENSNHLVMITAAQDEQGKENLKHLRYILGLSFLVGSIIALVSGYVFSKGLLKPIKKITNDVNEITAQNLARRIHTGAAKDEWYYLSNTFNELLNRLQESFDLQRRFIANASHELSTPLTSISSQLEVSLQRERTPEEYRQVMKSILQDVQHMNKLTQTLLEFAKASGTSAGLEINLIRVDEVLMRLPAELQKLNKSYSVSLDFEELPEDEEKLLVFGNEELLFTAVKNLVINACKYSDDHHAVIHFHPQTDKLIISVIDKGEGIPDNELDSIFQPFYRAEENKNTGGFGLGLSLAHRIIKLHKGDISVTSKKGQGTIFTIKLPSASQL